MWRGNCLFHAGTEKYAKIDAANLTHRWLCPDCSSKNSSILQVNCLNSPVLPSPCTTYSPNSRARMPATVKELNVESLLPLLSQKKIPSSQCLHHEEIFPHLEASSQTEGNATLFVDPSFICCMTTINLHPDSSEVSVQTEPFSTLPINQTNQHIRICFLGILGFKAKFALWNPTASNQSLHCWN